MRGGQPQPHLRTGQASTGAVEHVCFKAVRGTGASVGLSLSLSRYLSGGVRSCVELSVVNGKEGSQCCPGATGTVQSVYVP